MKMSFDYSDFRLLNETHGNVRTLKREIEQLRHDISIIKQNQKKVEEHDEEVLTDEDYAALRATQKRDFYKERQQRTKNPTPSYRVLPRGRGTTITGP